MWLFTDFGFFSVVCARETEDLGSPIDEHTLMIRSRDRGSLQTLLQRCIDRYIPGSLGDDPSEEDKAIIEDMLEYGKTLDIFENMGTDYPYRVFANKVWFGGIMPFIVSDINYDNFKERVRFNIFEGNDPNGLETNLRPEYLRWMRGVWEGGVRYEESGDGFTLRVTGNDSE